MNLPVSDLAALAQSKSLTIVFFPRTGEPWPMSPKALLKKYPAAQSLSVEATDYELRIREEVNPVKRIPTLETKRP